jgi:thymidine kinase
MLKKNFIIFIQITQTISVADKIDILHSKCNYYSENKHKKILVGDYKIYKSVCRKHYIQYNNN